MKSYLTKKKTRKFLVQIINKQDNSSTEIESYANNIYDARSFAKAAYCTLNNVEKQFIYIADSHEVNCSWFVKFKIWLQF